MDSTQKAGRERDLSHGIGTEQPLLRPLSSSVSNPPPTGDNLVQAYREDSHNDMSRFGEVRISSPPP